MVVGLKWGTDYQGLAYLEVKEGKLLPHGRIGNEYKSWTGQPDASYDFQHKRLVKRSNKNEAIPTDQYIIIRWGSRINLDDVPLPHGYVLTGVKLVESGNIIRLQCHGTKFDYEAGKLILDDTIWQDSQSLQINEWDDNIPRQYQDSR